MISDFLFGLGVSWIALGSVVAFVHFRHFKPADDPDFKEKFERDPFSWFAVLFIILIWPVVPFLWRQG